MEDEIKEWLKKIEGAKNGEIDLSRDEDLSIALMNIISLEEHFYFTAMKTGNEGYLEMAGSIRDIRKKLLAKIVTNPQGEEWCISKHLLASSMRLIEAGTKELGKNKDYAGFLFKSAFQLYSLFWGINLRLIEGREIKEAAASGGNGIMGKFAAIVKKIVDCCKE